MPVYLGSGHRVLMLVGILPHKNMGGPVERSSQSARLKTILTVLERNKGQLWVTPKLTFDRSLFDNTWPICFPTTYHGSSAQVIVGVGTAL